MSKVYFLTEVVSLAYVSLNNDTTVGYTVHTVLNNLQVLIWTTVLFLLNVLNWCPQTINDNDNDNDNRP